MTANKFFFQSQDNVDMFRASPQSLEKYSIEALNWLHGGNSPYPLPISIHFDLTLRCNARCIHCKQWTWPPHSEMNVVQLEKVLGIFKEWGVQTITLGGGNPLLHPNINLVLEIAAKANIRVGIITEGAELSEELVKNICKYAEWIRFSLDGPNSEIHDRIRNTKGLFNQAIENIKKLQLNKPDINIGINFVIQKSNYLLLNDMIKLAEQIGVGTLLFKLPHGNDPYKHYLLSEFEWDEFADWVRKNSIIETGSVRTNLKQLDHMIDKIITKQNALLGIPLKQFYTSNQIYCFVPLFFLICDSEGYMYPCDYLQADTKPWTNYQEIRSTHCLGNILESPQKVINQLEIMMRANIHSLPTDGYEVCGWCTRFYQMNSWLNNKNRDNQQMIEGESRKESFDFNQSENLFL